MTNDPGGHRPTKIEDLAFMTEDVMSAAEQELGKAEYKYYALPVRWSPGRGRRRGYHISAITEDAGDEITRDEWLEHKDQSQKDGTDAFMGRLKWSYTDYTYRVITPGWKQKLIHILEKSIAGDA